MPARDEDLADPGVDFGDSVEVDRVTQARSAEDRTHDDVGAVHHGAAACLDLEMRRNARARTVLIHAAGAALVEEELRRARLRVRRFIRVDVELHRAGSDARETVEMEPALIGRHAHVAY